MVWSREGSQGAEWNEAVVEFSLKPPATIINIEANLKEWNYGDIAIDDIDFSLGSCGRLSSSLKSKFIFGFFSKSQNKFTLLIEKLKKLHRCPSGANGVNAQANAVAEPKHAPENAWKAIRTVRAVKHRSFKPNCVRDLLVEVEK